MYRPEQLILTDFITHADTTFNFAEQQVTLICGKNNTDEGQESNGSGKSALVEGLYFAVQGRPLRDVRTEELIRDGCDKSCVSLQLKHTTTKEILTVTRKIYSSRKSSEVEIVSSVTGPVELVNVDDARKYLLGRFGLVNGDIESFFIITKDKYSPLFLMTDGEKKKVTGRLSKVELLHGIDKVIKSSAEVHEQAVAKMDVEIARLEGSRESVLSRIESLKKQLQDDSQLQRQQQLELQIAELNESRDKQIRRLAEAEQKVIETSSQIEKTSAQIERLKKKSLEQDSAVNASNNECQQLRLRMAKVNGQIAKIDTYLAGLIECPKCTHNFNPVTRIEESVESIQSKRAVRVDLVESLVVEIAQHESQLSQFREQQQQVHVDLRKTTDRSHQLTQTLETEKATQNRCKQEIASINNRIQHILSTISDTKQSTDKLVAELSKYESECEQMDLKISKLAEERGVQLVKVQETLQWIGHFKRFYTYLTNRSLAAIEGYTNMFLQKINTNLSVSIQEESTTSTGKSTDKISVTVARDGEVRGSFGRYSGGEKLRVNLCTILAEQELINNSSPDKGLDLLVLDEVIESVDSIGAKELLDVLNKVQRTIVVITHSPLDSRVPNTIWIEKNDEVSSIINKS